MEHEFKVGDEVIITSWHYATIDLPQKGVIEYIDLSSCTPYRILIEKDHNGHEDQWYFRLGEFIPIPEKGTKFTVITGRVPDGFYRTHSSEFERLGADLWNGEYTFTGIEVINNKIYVGFEESALNNKILITETSLINNKPLKEEKMEKMNEFVVKGSVTLVTAFVKDCIEAGIKVSDELYGRINKNQIYSDDIIGSYRDSEIGFMGGIAPGTITFNLPQEYTEALDYAKKYYPQSKKEVLNYDMDGYSLKIEEGLVKFGCKHFTKSQLKNIITVMGYLNNISDEGSRNVELHYDSITVENDSLSITGIKKLLDALK